MTVPMPPPNITPDAITALVHGAVEIAAAIVLVIAPLWLIRWYTRRTHTDGRPWGLGRRALQVIVIVMMVPAVLILALEKIIDAALIGTLIGSLLGYVLSPKDGIDSQSGGSKD
jgi:hypothetical protein